MQIKSFTFFDDYLILCRFFVVVFLNGNLVSKKKKKTIDMIETYMDWLLFVLEICFVINLII